MLEIKNIYKSYGEKQVLEDFSCTMPDSGVVLILGESGIGKTTLLRLIMGLEMPDRGSIDFIPYRTIFSEEAAPTVGAVSAAKASPAIESVSITGIASAIGPVPTFSAVFQEDRLLEHKSALNNVMLVMTEQNANGHGSLSDIASSILSDLGLKDELHTKVCKLSGGMKRRVAIARSLAVKADIYIMDEPIKGLDGDTRLITLNAIRRLTEGSLLIMVSHNEKDIALADHVIRIRP